MEMNVESIRARLRRSVNRGVLAPAGALYDASRARRRADVTKPFNGQSGRQAIVEDLLGRFRPDAIVETGTFHGSSTDYFTRVHRGPVISIEATPRFFWYARVRLLGRRNLRLIQDDSRAALRALAREPGLTGGRVLCYLDAHWEHDLPLGDELQILARSFQDWIAVVDDFAVPDDPGYAFDTYGADRTLDRAYLQRVGLPGLQMFWPRARACDEDGMRRGCVVLTTVPAAADVLRQSALLRTLED